MADRFEEGTSAEDFRHHITYDPISGEFRRLHAWGRAAKGGNPVFRDTSGYGVIAIMGKRFYAHRVAWLMVTGEFPPSKMVIDHINRDRMDNRFSNLRIGEQRLNTGNTPKSKNNKSGYKGVSMTRGKWRATIMKNRRQIWLGTFPTAEDAARAYARAAKEVFGEFACF